MKKLFSYSIILMALCALVSCSNDDDNNGSGSGSGKNAKKLLYSPYVNFIYNDKGKLEKAGDMTFVWTNNSVECTDSRDNKWIALLSNDKIIKTEETSIDYSGDKLTKMAYNGNGWNYDETITYKWDGDNITESNYSDDYKKQNTTYTYYPDKKGNGAIDVLYIKDFHIYGYTSLLLAHPWLMGKSNKNLIKSKTIHYSNGKTETINYTYEFDTNGNPIKVYENGNFSESFLWEL